MFLYRPPVRKSWTKKLSTWMYATGQDLDMAVWWRMAIFRAFVALLRTTYAPPSRWKMGELLLDSC